MLPTRPRRHVRTASSAFQQSGSYRDFCYDDLLPPRQLNLSRLTADVMPTERAAKRQRVEALARDFIDGSELFIPSARTREPVRTRAVDLLAKELAPQADEPLEVEWQDIDDDVDTFRKAKRGKRIVHANTTRPAGDLLENRASQAVNSPPSHRRSTRTRAASNNAELNKGSSEHQLDSRPRKTRVFATSGRTSSKNNHTTPNASTFGSPGRNGAVQNGLRSRTRNPSANKANLRDHSGSEGSDENRPFTVTNGLLARDSVSFVPAVDPEDPSNRPLPQDAHAEAAAALARFRGSIGYGAQFTSTYIADADEEDEPDLHAPHSPRPGNLSPTTAQPSPQKSPKSACQVSPALGETRKNDLIESIEAHYAQPPALLIVHGDAVGQGDKSIEFHSDKPLSQSSAYKSLANHADQRSLQWKRDANLISNESRKVPEHFKERPELSRLRRNTSDPPSTTSNRSRTCLQEEASNAFAETNRTSPHLATTQRKPGRVGIGHKQATSIHVQTEEKGHTPPPMNEEQASMMSSFSIHNAPPPSTEAMSMLGLEYGKNRKLQRAKTTGAPSVSNPGRPEGWVPCHPGRGPMSQDDPRRAIDPKLPKGQQNRMTAFRIELSRPKPLYTTTSPAPNDETPFKFRKRTATPEDQSNVSMNVSQFTTSSTAPRKDQNHESKPEPVKERQKSRRVTYPSSDADQKGPPTPSRESIMSEAVVRHETQSAPEPTERDASTTPGGSAPPPAGRIVKDAQGNNVIETPIPVAKPFVEMELDFTDSFGQELNIALNERHVNSVLKDRGSGESAAAMKERLRRELLMSGAVITDTTSQSSIMPIYDANSPVIGKYRKMMKKTAAADSIDEHETRAAGGASSMEVKGNDRPTQGDGHGAASEPQSQAWPGTQVMLDQAQRGLISPTGSNETLSNVPNFTPQNLKLLGATTRKGHAKATDSKKTNQQTPQSRMRSQRMLSAWSPWSAVKQPFSGLDRDAEVATGEASSAVGADQHGSSKINRGESNLAAENCKSHRGHSNLRNITNISEGESPQIYSDNVGLDSCAASSVARFRSFARDWCLDKSDRLETLSQGASETSNGDCWSECNADEDKTNRDRRDMSAYTASVFHGRRARQRVQMKDESQMTQTISDLTETMLQHSDMGGVLSQV